MVSSFLLDVNVLIALAWPAHIHHRSAHDWFIRQATHGWATCPFTQCGFVRLSSSLRLTEDAVSPREAIKFLADMETHPNHNFWPDAVSLTDSAAFNPGKVVGHKQVTDAYLLTLAIAYGGRLATYDRGISALIPAGTDADTCLAIIQ